MSVRTLGLSDQLSRYLQTTTVRESDDLKQLRLATSQLPEMNMQISPEQGQLMALLVKLVGARRIIEVGVFTGYSSLAMAKALPDDGKLTACDVSEEWTKIARRYWAAAGVDHKINLRLAPALETLDALLADGEQGGYDLAFIDADKLNYEPYYQRCLELLRPGGLILVDNTLWGGAVADEEDQSEDTIAIRAFNEKVANDPRVMSSLVTIGDGLTFAMKL